MIIYPILYRFTIIYIHRQTASAAGSSTGPGGDSPVVSVGSSSAVVQGSPLVSRRDMQGLIRQVIGQERSPAPSSSSVNAGGGGVKPSAPSAAAPPKHRSVLIYDFKGLTRFWAGFPK